MSFVLIILWLMKPVVLSTNTPRAVETDGAVGDQALNELGDNEELHTTLEGRIRRLIQMHEDGLITESELSERRREILREV